MSRAVACVEKTTLDRNKCVVKIGLQGAIAMRVDKVKGSGIGNGCVVRGNANDRTCEDWGQAGKKQNLGIIEEKEGRSCGGIVADCIHTVFPVQFVNDLGAMSVCGHPA